MLFRAIAAVAALACGAVPAAWAGELRPLAQSPTLSRTEIAFTYGGYLWSVPRAGGTARRLTDGGVEGRAVFSPDGKWLAYSSGIGFKTDAYVIPASGGTPTRLTWHPGDDVVVGWTPDSRRVLFASSRDSYARFHRLYTVPVEGGWQEPLPMWRGIYGAFSPDASRIAYIPNDKTQKDWKRYAGGQTTPIHLIRRKDLQVEKIPRANSNDADPVWIGDTVYFLSDRSGPVTIFAYDTSGKSVRQVLDNRGMDLKTLSAGPDALVYEQFGDVHLFQPGTGISTRVDIRIAEPPPGLAPQTLKLGSQAENPALAPAGDAVLFEARGEIFHVRRDGGTENLTRSAGVADRLPAWSPDGGSVAWLSDESGEYALHVRALQGDGQVRRIDLGNPPSFYEAPPRWSPDGSRILLQDKRLNLWCVEVATGIRTRIDAALFETDFQPVWSPDSRWIAYMKLLPNQLQAIFLHSLEQGRSVQVTDGGSDARYPAFDRSGEMLLFAASTDLALSMSSREMSALFHPVTRNIYAAALRGTGAAAASLDNIAARIVPLPVPAGNYVGLDAGRPGFVLLQELPAITTRRPFLDPATVSRFDLGTGERQVLFAGVTRFQLSASGEQALFQRGRDWVLAGTAEPLAAGAGVLNLAGMEIRTDPPAEWKQIYREAWRQQRDGFYDPNAHGLDLVAAARSYESYLQRVGSREDLHYLFREMMGNLTVGHLAVGGGFPVPVNADARNVGLLGADYRIDRGRYQFARIFDGEAWNPDAKAPLASPELRIKAGAYLLRVNGQELRPPTDLYSLFADTAGKPTRIAVASDPGGRDVRELTVTPVADEMELRNRAWQEENRRKVDALSGGRIAYVAVPDTSERGFRNFNRAYFSQTDKQAAIIDDRYNGGGRFPDYIVDVLARPRRMCSAERDVRDGCMPAAQIFGPKTMLINEMAISGGEALAWMFRHDRLGQLVGTRTWGGLVASGSIALIDGSRVATPSPGFYDPDDGSWVVENRGVVPDLEVENDAAGDDAQLAAAVRVTLAELQAHPLTPLIRPAFPSYPNDQEKQRR